ncbi:MAG: ABC transporter ATP-binding protein [Acidimicrobiia bacterium]|nr:ABC transporter ATP-binding protein [Acidimicrobiia bacterium]
MTIELRDVTVRRGDRTVLADLDLTVDAGVLTAIVGPNGAGKSTMLGVIAGDLAPQRGRVTIDGRDIHGLAPRDAARVRAFLAQDHPGGIEFTVKTVVGFGRHAVGEFDDPVVDRSIEAVGVGHLAMRRFRDLSGGEQRRVSIARVLAQDAPTLLMDEPTDSLDLGHADLVMATAARVAAEGKTVLVTSHDLNVAARHADRIVLVVDGRIAASGAPNEVLTADLLSSVYHTEVRILPHPDTGAPVVFL